jgi:hypothetical protein
MSKIVLLGANRQFLSILAVKNFSLRCAAWSASFHGLAISCRVVVKLIRYHPVAERPDVLLLTRIDVPVNTLGLASIVYVAIALGSQSIVVLEALGPASIVYVAIALGSQSIVVLEALGPESSVYVVNNNDLANIFDVVNNVELELFGHVS